MPGKPFQRCIEKWDLFNPLNKQGEKMKKILLPLILIIIILSSCDKVIELNLIYYDIGNLNSESYVYLEDGIIGKVIEVKRSEEIYNVKIVIDREYEEYITTETEFFLINKKKTAKIIAKNSGNKGELLKNGAVIKGKNEFEYHLSKGFGKIKNSTEMFFKSEEWKGFRKKIDQVIEKGMEKSEKRFPEINDQINEFLEKFNERYDETMKDKVQPFLDTLIMDLNEIFEEDEDKKE